MSELGRYIVIEGNDGTGKSTQVALLQKHYEQAGKEAVLVEEPSSDDTTRTTLVASYLRNVIKNGDLQRDAEINLALFSAARRELWHEIIQPALGRGAVVLAARNYVSTLVYQGYGEGIPLYHIREVTLQFTDSRYLEPDNTIILTLNSESERTARIAKRGALERPDTFESRDDDFQKLVNDGYLKIAREMNLPTIDCIANDDRRKTIDEIHQEILQILEQT